MAVPGSYIFIDANADLRDAKVRKQVRSRAAAHSHMNAPRKSRGSRRVGDRENPLGIARRGRGRDLGRQQAELLELSGTSESASSDSSSDVKKEDDSLTEDSDDRPEAKYSPGESQISLRSSNLSTSSTKGIAAQPQFRYPVPFQPWFPQTLRHAPEFILRGWRIMDASDIERKDGVRFVIQTAMSEPAYFYVNMLSVTDYYVQRGEMDPKISTWLSAKLVAALNRALRARDEAFSIGVLLAVCRISMRETLYGDREVGQKVHRPALARMLNMSGGLEGKGLPALCYRHLQWAERLCTHATGVSMIDMEPDLARYWHDDAVGDHASDVKVLDGFLPRRTKPTSG